MEKTSCRSGASVEGVRLVVFPECGPLLLDSVQGCTIGDRTVGDAVWGARVVTGQTLQVGRTDPERREIPQILADRRQGRYRGAMVQGG